MITLRIEEVYSYVSRFTEQFDFHFFLEVGKAIIYEW